MNRGFLSRVVFLVMPATCLWAFQTGAEFSLYHKCRKPDVQPGNSGRIPFTTRNIMAVIMPRFGLCTVGIVSHSTRNAVSYPAKSPAIRALPPIPFTNPLQSQVCNWCAGKCSFCFTTQVHMYYYCKTVPKHCPCTYVILLQHFVPKLCPCTYVLLLQNFVPKYIRTVRTTFVYIRTSVYQSLL